MKRLIKADGKFNYYKYYSKDLNMLCNKLIENIDNSGIDLDEIRNMTEEDNYSDYDRESKLRSKICYHDEGVFIPLVENIDEISMETLEVPSYESYYDEIRMAIQDLFDNQTLVKKLFDGLNIQHK